MKRMGMVIGVKPEKLDDYKRLHAAVWPDVLAQIAKSNICSCTNFLREPENLLFGCWNITALISKGTWPAWRKAPERRNGGLSPTLAKARCPAAPKANNGHP